MPTGRLDDLVTAVPSVTVDRTFSISCGTGDFDCHAGQHAALGVAHGSGDVARLGVSHVWQKNQGDHCSGSAGSYLRDLELRWDMETSSSSPARRAIGPASLVGRNATVPSCALSRNDGLSDDADIGLGKSSVSTPFLAASCDSNSLFSETRMA